MKAVIVFIIFRLCQPFTLPTYNAFIINRIGNNVSVRNELNKYDNQFHDITTILQSTSLSTSLHDPPTQPQSLFSKIVENRMRERFEDRGDISRVLNSWRR